MHEEIDYSRTSPRDVTAINFFLINSNTSLPVCASKHAWAGACRHARARTHTRPTDSVYKCRRRVCMRVAYFAGINELEDTLL